MGRYATDLTGRVLGRLTIESRADNIGECAAWNCLCSCGQRRVIRAHSLKQKANPTESCGCLHREAMAARYASLRVAGRRRYTADEIIAQTFASDPRFLLRRLGIRVPTIDIAGSATHG